jgi:hypothetical protein
VECWFGRVYESNGLFLSRETWDLIGGFDERFDAPGGGLVNHDTLLRALELPDSELVVLLGEGMFHQLHGGIATNADLRTSPGSQGLWSTQYLAIRGKPFQPSERPTRSYLGTLPPAALAHFARSIVEPIGPSPIPRLRSDAVEFRADTSTFGSRDRGPRRACRGGISRPAFRGGGECRPHRPCFRP